MARHFSAIRLWSDSEFANGLPHIPCLSNPRIHTPEATIKNGSQKPAYKFLVSRVAAWLLLLQPATCHAAVAALPWDHALFVLQDMLISTVAPAAIGLAVSGAAILYALGGRRQGSRPPSLAKFVKRKGWTRFPGRNGPPPAGQYQQQYERRQGRPLRDTG